MKARTRVAFASLLFNWPSTGGGTVHTFEATKFLGLAGYDVCHFYAVQDHWKVGAVSKELAVASAPLHFAAKEWTEGLVRDRFQRAISQFAPDYVIITDSWNTKPLLAEAVGDHAYFLRIAAMECLCPLNNVRMVVNDDGSVLQCEKDQLSDPDSCFRCVQLRVKQSGGLHRAERALAGFDRRDYPVRLKNAITKAAGVLAVNPLVAEPFRTLTDRVHVIPSGFDPMRFPVGTVPRSRREVGARKQVFFAGLINEFMKGFSILLEAGAALWKCRQDFELVVTAEAPDRPYPFVRFIGWKSQAELPFAIADADILAFPTFAQEALGRSAVEAMGCGRPVVASRLGGLPWVVEDGRTGLLFEPGNSAQLARQLERLLDDPALCDRLGRAGRAKFEQAFTWDRIIARHYLPLFRPR